MPHELRCIQHPSLTLALRGSTVAHVVTGSNAMHMLRTVRL